MIAPFTKLDAGRQRLSVIWATSSGWPGRFIGVSAPNLLTGDDIAAMAELVKGHVLGEWGAASVTNIVAVEGQFVGEWRRARTARR